SDKADPALPDYNCVPFVSVLAIRERDKAAFIVMEKMDPLPKRKTQEGETELPHDTSDDGTNPVLRRAEEAKKCLSIMNEKIGVTHGDFKQDNVQVHPKTKALRLIDFGLSTAWIEDPKTGNLDLIAGQFKERRGQFAGTPEFMHP
ncbi:unnamed protein product, partial [Amoebophrya sp. A25]